MKRKGLMFRAACVGLIPLVFIVDLSGCATTGGTSLGPLATPPYRSADGTASRGLAIVALDPGTEVEILTRGDSRIHGEFRGVVRMSEARYAAHVDSVWSSVAPKSRPPAPGTRVTIYPRPGKPWTGRLVGYAFRGVEVLRDGHRSPVLLRFDKLSELRGEDDRVWTPLALDDEAVAGRLPAFSEIVVRLYDQDRSIPVDQILSVSYRSDSGDWVAGALVGAVLGAVLVLYLIAQSFHQSTSRCAGPAPNITSTLSSRCPTGRTPPSHAASQER